MESRGFSQDEYLSRFYKTDRLLPVMTLTVFYSAEEWDGPLTLREMYSGLEDAVMQHVPDYRVNLIAPGNMTEYEIGEFQSSLKEVLLYIKYSKDKEKLQERLAKMAGGVAVLYVGAPSEVEMKEKKDRVDDALHATRAAIEEGTVPGGGVAYIRAIEALDGLKGENEDETTGIEIVKRAIEEPLRQIVANAGKEGAVVVQKVKEGKGDFGYNARADKYENLCAAGVIDPAKVTRVALENAASIAGMFLTTECVIAEKKEETPAAPAMNPGMGGMGGMMLRSISW